MDDIEAEDAAEALRKLRQRSNEAIAKFEDYCTYQYNLLENT